MPVKVNTEALSGFTATLRQLANTDKIAEKLANEGVRIAKEQYGNSDAIYVSARKVADSHYLVKANGSQVLYFEFGTGFYAQGTYAAATQGEGKIPDVPVQLENGQTLPRWTYYYDSPAKATVNGKKGWFLSYKSKSRFITGFPAKAHLWRTGKILREKIQNGEITKILGHDGNV